MIFRDKAFYTEEQLGEKQSITPEGFLLCEAVPIARTGMMMYGDGEIISGDGEDALEAGSDGWIRVTRSDEDVFHPNTIASFEGKSVTDDHPDQAVTPVTFREVEIGTTHNVRRGDGIHSDCLVADLLIKDQDVIRAIQDGKRQISCGYDADYEQTAPGRARQFNIIGNHVALVDRGRCGPRCAIGDEDMATRDKKPSFLDRLTAKLKGATNLTADSVLALARDAEKEDEEDKKEKSTNDRLSKIEATLDGLPKMIADALGARDAGEGGDDEDDEDMTEDEDGDDKEDDKDKDKTKDAANRASTVDAKTMRDALQTVRAHAEVLSPGFNLNIPTMDAKTSRQAFADSMCNCKRKVLDVAYRTEDGRKVIEPFLNGRTADFKSMNAKTIDTIFTGAAILRAQKNNDAAASGIRPNLTRDDFGRAPITNDALNDRHREFWKSQGSASK